MSAKEQVDFHFRTKNGYKRPTVSVEMDLPTSTDVVDLIQGEDAKVRSMLVEAVQSIVYNHVRGYVNDNTEFDQATLEALETDGKTSLEHIAHIPKADRNVLSKDDLEQFAQDYIEYMPEITGKEVERVQAAAGLFVERFKRAAGDNNVLKVLQEQLSAFVEGAPDEVVERNERVINWASGKLEELLSVKITADVL